MAKLRTIEKAYQEIITQDPGSCLTKHFIRKLILDGKIPAKREGNKFLFDLEDLMAYLKK